MAEAALKEPSIVRKLQPRGTLQIASGRVDLAEFRGNVWKAFPEEGTDYETILSESYWVHPHAFRKMSIGDEIVVLPDEMTYYARLLVVDSGPNRVKVVELFRKELSVSDPVEAGAEYVVEWKGPHRKHAVIRVRDKAIVKDGFAQKSEAIANIPPPAR